MGDRAMNLTGLNHAETRHHGAMQPMQSRNNPMNHLSRKSNRNGDWLERLVLTVALSFTFAMGAQVARANDLRAMSRADLRAHSTQTDAIQRLTAISGGEVKINRDADKGTIRALKGSLLQPAAQSLRPGEKRSTKTACDFLRTNKQLLGVANPDAEFAVARESTGRLNQHHIRYQQRFNGLPVWPSHLSVHLNKQGDVYLVNGSYIRTPVLDTTPTLSAEEAATRAEAGVAEDGAQAEHMELIVYVPDRGGVPKLAWKMDIHGRFAHQHWQAVIDAQSGEALLLHSTICTAAAQGSGTDTWGTQRNLNIWHEETEGLYYMIDASKPMFDPNNFEGVIRILDAQNQMMDDNPNFTTYAIASSSPTSGWIPDAVSAAFGLSATFDYFDQFHQRNSLDGQGGTISAVVQYGINFPNAFWHPDMQTMFFGQAEQYAGALDVVAHELTHGVTSSTSNLVYRFQSGSLSEAMSDIFGELVERFAYGQNDWLLGDDLSVPMRDFINPNNILDPQVGPLPERMSEFYDLPIETDEGGVHINSSIINHCFYQLAEGLNGSIGMEDAAQIFYRANTVHLGPSSQFVDARLACIQSAEEIFGAGSSQVQMTASAFDAVEIFDGATTTPPGPGGNDDEFEENDSAERVARIEPGIHSLQGMDEDWFFFEVTNPGPMELTIAGPSGDLDLFVYDTEANLLAQSENEGSNDGVSGDVQAGTFVIRVVPFQNQTSSYTLTLTVAGAGGPGKQPPPAKDDRFEENDTANTATPISPGSYELEGNDVDFFVFDLDGERIVTVTIDGPTGDLDMCILNARGEPIDCSENEATNELIEQTLPAGRYFVIVAPYEQDLTSSYTLTLEVGGSGSDMGNLGGGGICGAGVPMTAIGLVVGMLGLGTTRRRRMRRTACGGA